MELLYKQTISFRSLASTVQGYSVVGVCTVHKWSELQDVMTKKPEVCQSIYSCWSNVYARKIICSG
jgi:hypothetical protein